MAYKVIQWGAGRNGQALIRAVARHPDLELVGVKIWSAEKDGVDAGTLAGIEPLGVAATTDKQALKDLDADVVLFCPNLRPDMTESDNDICDLLRSGKNVISVTGAHSMPTALPGYGEQFETACWEGGSSFAAAGVNPGFMAERLAPTLTGLCADVEAVTVQETYLCSGSSGDIAFDTIGFGRRPEEWSAESPVGGMFNHLFTQLVHNMARSLGVELKEVRRTVHVGACPSRHPDRRRPGAEGHGGRGRPELGRRAEGPWPNPGRQAHLLGRGRRHRGNAGEVGLADPGRGQAQRGDRDPHRAQGRRGLSGRGDGGRAIGVIPEIMAAPPGILLPTIYAPFKRRFA